MTYAEFCRIIHTVVQRFSKVSIGILLLLCYTITITTAINMRYYSFEEVMNNSYLVVKLAGCAVAFMGLSKVSKIMERMTP